MILSAAVAVLGSAGAAAAARRPAFAPYVDLTQYPSPQLAAIRRSSGLHQLTLAFVTSRGTTACAPAWGGYATLPATGARAFDRAAVASLQRSGARAAISFGGQAGAELATTCATPAALAKAYDAVIAAYRPRRIDFDVEGAAVADPASIDRRSRALALVQRTHPRLPISLTLPSLPTGLDSDGLRVVRSALRHHVRIAEVNLMTMDYGDAAAPNPQGRMGAYAVAAARHAIAQLRGLEPRVSARQAAAMIGITPMIGINDVSDEIFTLADARTVAAYAAASGIGLLSMWQIERDRQCAQPVTTAQDACSGVTQAPYQFARTL